MAFSTADDFVKTRNPIPNTEPMIRSLALTLLMTPLVQGQSSSISTHILTFAPAKLPEGFQSYFVTEGRLEPFAASAATLGLPIPYNGPREFTLYLSKTDSKSQVASVTLPEKCDHVLIICTPTTDEKVSLAAYKIDSSDFKAGDYRVFNFSKSSVSMNLGDQTIELAPEKDGTVRDSKWANDDIALPVKIATVLDGKNRPVYSSFREHSPKDRTLMFLFDGTHPSRPITFTTFNAETVTAKPASEKKPSSRRKP